jgi:hypothetical protein
MQDETKQELTKLAENLSEDVVEAVFKILEIEIKASENKIDDAILPFLPMGKSFVLKYVAKLMEMKINGVSTL